MVIVIMVGLLMMFLFTVGWYFTNAITAGFVSTMFGGLTSTTEGAGLLNIVLFINAVWGPVFDVIVLMWMIQSAQMRDVESEMYG